MAYLCPEDKSDEMKAENLKLEYSDLIIEEDQDMKHCICGICKMIVKEPRECSSCDSEYCETCVKLTAGKNVSCPNCLE